MFNNLQKKGIMIKVSIVEDSVEVKQDLCEQIELVSDMQLAGAYGSGEAALVGILRDKPDVVIMDIGLPKMDGIRTMFHIKEKQEGIRFLMFTVFQDSEHIFEALKVGADGYILKTEPMKRILDSIREIMRDGAPMSRAIAKKVFQSFRVKQEQNKLIKALTPRQRQILDQLSKGFYYKEIGDNLGITEGTVKQHIHKIYKKLQVNNRTEAINTYRNGVSAG